jgi:hypothetical protein
MSRLSDGRIGGLVAAQSMFVVTSAGVIATDPIGYGRPQAVVTYVDALWGRGT